MVSLRLLLLGLACCAAVAAAAAAAAEEPQEAPERPKTPVEEVEALLRGDPTADDTRPTVCTMEYLPVKDTKTGKEYSNQCMALAAGANPEDLVPLQPPTSSQAPNPKP